ncbi:hypothetical protein N798_07535 [Knoellia flava TL1]|uniref:DUF1905 domain-containing protein n=2 Tax=Knoellia flava TaxID=913969 RepID=A0A8H9FV83_9MICO|nr:DUF1905 domain-containing protein [Knoellia flava]KGN32199.1 hypothetical protein N798_07535 [Knoellia flava TL1]GGB89486.1 hypothetical protein GCM10011314_31650 [Knoellia flava]
MRFSFTAPLWEWSAQGGWFFVTLPTDAADDIAELDRPDRGFGSVRVRVTVGATTWSTSVFPDTKLGSYVLPVKKAVRKAEGIEDGDDVDVTIEVLDA